MTEQRFRDRTIIVTGAGSGIGRATAVRLATEGAHIIGVDTSRERLRSLEGQLGETITTVDGDLTAQLTIDRALAVAGTRIDGLANIAGIMDGFEPTAEIRKETWERVLAVNLTAVMQLTRAVLPAMLEAANGAIVNVSSEAGHRGSAAGTPYTVSKHAVNGLTLSTAFFYTPNGIRCNAIAPGPGRHEHRSAIPVDAGSRASRTDHESHGALRLEPGSGGSGDRLASQRRRLRHLRRRASRRRRVGGNLT